MDVPRPSISNYDPHNPDPQVQLNRERLAGLLGIEAHQDTTHAWMMDLFLSLSQALSQHTGTPPHPSRLENLAVFVEETGIERCFQTVRDYLSTHPDALATDAAQQPDLLADAATVAGSAVRGMDEMVWALYRPSSSSGWDLGDVAVKFCLDALTIYRGWRPEAAPGYWPDYWWWSTSGGEGGRNDDNDGVVKVMMAMILFRCVVWQH